jgi:Cu-processing system permease protein
VSHRLRSILGIARIAIIEQIRNRLYLVIFFFGALVVLASALMGALAPGHRTRVIMDLGLVTLELFGLVTAVFGAVSLVLQETDSKTIYLILTRPVHRSTYILGRFVGLVSAVSVTMLAMAILLLGVMVFDMQSLKEFADGWSLWAVYPMLLLMSLGKMLITASIALFFSLFASSQVSALVFTGAFWIAGHFGSEMKFLLDKSVQGGAGRGLAGAILSVMPNFQYLNFRDTFQVPGFSGWEFMGTALVYAAAYAGFFLVLSTLWFARKEF